MKTMMVLSDSHGRRRVIEKLSPLFAENDYIVHLGDGASDMREVTEQYPEKVYAVKGNCDFSRGINELVLEAEGVRFLLCHGHAYGVKTDLSRLVAHAKSLGCAVALYGHTHRAAIEEMDGVTCINPGSAGAYSDPSYCYLVVQGEKVVPKIVQL